MRVQILRRKPIYALVAQRQSGCFPNIRPRFQNSPSADFHRGDDKSRRRSAVNTVIRMDSRLEPYRHDHSFRRILNVHPNVTRDGAYSRDPGDDGGKELTNFSFDVTRLLRPGMMDLHLSRLYRSETE